MKLLPYRRLDAEKFLKNLRILASHPVQYQVQLFRELASKGQNIEVGYYHRGTAGNVGHDRDFGIDISWDIDLLSNYPYHFFLNKTASYQILEQIKIFPRLAIWALKNRSEPILFVGWFAEVVWLIWLLAILIRKPVFVYGDNTPMSFSAVPKPAWRIGFLRWLLRHTSAGFFAGSLSKRFYLNMGMSNNQLYPALHCIDNQRFASEAQRLSTQRVALCMRYRINPDMPTFLFCGKFIPKKRPLELLEAYCAAELMDKAQLVYVGEGMLRLDLERRIQALGLKHVHLLGFLNQTQMPLAYVIGELLCLISSPTETWGLVVNEAMACGRPVIVADSVGCTPDLVDETNGWVVAGNDPAALAQALRRAYAERQSWGEKGAQSLKKISRHTYAVMAEGVIKALAEVNSPRVTGYV